MQFGASTRPGSRVMQSAHCQILGTLERHPQRPLTTRSP